MQIQLQSPIPDSYWIISGRLLAGRHPSLNTEGTTRQSLQSLLKAQITVFIDLTEATKFTSYERLAQLEAKPLNCSVRYVCTPVQERGTPTVEEMVKILDLIDEALAQDQRVYVHCLSGVGRTGLVTGCYLARHGMNKDEIFKEVARLRRGTSLEYLSSVDTPEQRQMVISWPEGK